MKTPLLLILALSPAAFAREVTCVSNGMLRNDIGDIKVDARFVIDFARKEEGQTKVIAQKIVGHVVAGDIESPNTQYYSVFAMKNAEANPNYKPRKYMNHVQFKNTDATASSSEDGGGMWGELVVSKDYAKEDVANFDAFYIFKSGDHLGGTIDLRCSAD